MRCQICQCVGISQNDADEAATIVGDGCETMCADCAWNLLEAAPGSIEDAKDMLETADRRQSEFPLGRRIARKLREAALKAYPESEIERGQNAKS